SELESWSDAQRSLAQAGLQDSDAFVQRAAADALGRHPALDSVRPLLALRQNLFSDGSNPPTNRRAGGEEGRSNSQDTELIYKIRQALRDQLRAPGVFARLPLANVSESDARAIADVAVGIQSADAGSFLLRHIQKVS